MSEKIFTVSIIGCGARGKDVYGSYMKEIPEHYKIVALCDINKIKLEIAKMISALKKQIALRTKMNFLKKDAPTL